MNPPNGVDAYIASAPAAVRPLLDTLRQTIKDAAPAAEERISYRMPAYFLNGPLVYFAAFKNHLGLYPPVRTARLKPMLERYAGPKGNLKFPLAEPLPLALITQIIQARIQENQALSQKKNTDMSIDTQAKGPASYFPSIEKKYGKPMQHWFGLVEGMTDKKHMEIVAWLKTEHGMGHGHANAVVAHLRAQQK